MDTSETADTYSRVWNTIYETQAASKVGEIARVIFSPGELNPKCGAGDGGAA